MHLLFMPIPVLTYFGIWSGSGQPCYPKSQSKEDLHAAELADLFNTQSFLDPTVLGTIPEKWIDCWSWLNSYKNRYGFYRLDLETDQRSLKKSGIWFKALIDRTGLI